MCLFEVLCVLCVLFEFLMFECVIGEVLFECMLLLFDVRWWEVRFMLGVWCLLEYLRARGVSFGLATSTSATYLKEKMCGYEDVLVMMDCVVMGCMVN